MNEAIRTIRNHCATVGCEKCAYNEKGCLFNKVKPHMWDAPKFSDEDIRYIKTIETWCGGNAEIVKADGVVFLAQRRLIEKHFSGMRNGERFTISEILTMTEKEKQDGKTI